MTDATDATDARRTLVLVRGLADARRSGVRIDATDAPVWPGHGSAASVASVASVFSRF
jgi:hypothetical protein